MFRYRIKHVEGDIRFHYFTMEDIEHGITSELYSGSIILSRDRWTGLHDKNTKRIFEGDIIIWKDEEYERSELGVVVFKDGTFKLKHPMCYKKDYNRGYDEMITFWKDGIHDWQTIENHYMDFERIGNIYDDLQLVLGVET